MSDILGKMTAVFIAILALIYIPILSLSLKMENTTRSMIETYVTQFVDNARATGKITPEEYESCYSKIALCQDFCTLEMTHSSRMYAAGEEEAVGYYSDFNTRDILDVMYNSEADEIPYEMRNGDYFTVTVKNAKPTLATRLYRLVFRRSSSDTSIYVTYSGIVGNYIEVDE